METTEITLRDYFIAHAPAEPQPWFKPVMPLRPLRPNFLKDLTPEQRLRWGQLDYASDDLDEELADDPVLADFVKRDQQAIRAQHDHDIERAKQRYVQWPGAWASAMLAQRALNRLEPAQVKPERFLTVTTSEGEG